MSDPSSLSNPQEVKASHLHLDVNVDFKRCTIAGSVEFNIEVQQDGAKEFVLDTRDLAIKSAAVDGKAVSFSLGDASEPFGARLAIPLPSTAQKKGSKATVKVHYSTSPHSSACAWLPPPQTAGKKRPFLFTQCQAIHARSLLPCQDCPGTKCTWSAQVSAAAWATVLMSALQKKAGQPTSSGVLTWQYEQPVPTCTYLIALAVGELKGRNISARCKVWAEPSMIDAAAWEFADTEKFLAIAESLTCPYQWSRYDVLCLPPSFPYGGMENPCLTFVTPTLLAGDRSLADVIAHEIAHSWTGNLVTNATWEHFWLNEGWTTWLQRRIMMHVEAERKGLSKPSKADFDFQAMGGWSSLGASISRFVEAKQGGLTKLVPDLDGIDPDEAFSVVPYEKGFNLLYAMQNQVGEEPFLAFVKAYVQEFKSKLVTSEAFKEFAVAHFGAKIGGFNWDGWMYQEGMPPTSPSFDKSIVTSIEKVCAGWVDASRQSFVPTDPSMASKAQSEVEVECQRTWRSWSSSQQQLLLDLLLDATTNHSGTNPDAKLLPLEKLSHMDRLYGLNQSRNCEIRFRWCTLCLRHGADLAMGAVLDMLATQGRMKYTRPLYRDLAKFRDGTGKTLALQTFNKNRRFYHPICRKMVAIDLGASATDGGGSLMSWKGALGCSAALTGVYLAWAWWQVKNNRCPIPFHNLMTGKKN